MKNSISIRFALAAVAAPLFILGLTGIIIYILIRDELLEDAKEKAQLVVENSRYKIDALVSYTQKDSERVKVDLEASNLDEKNIKTLLTQTLDKESSFFGMAMAFEPSSIILKPFSPYYYKKNNKIAYLDLANADYDYLSQLWYSKSFSTGLPSWSEPYFDEGGGNTLMSTYSNPIIYKGEFSGILTIDLSLEKLQEIVSSIHILDTGYAFLLSKERKVLVHPDKSKIMTVYKNQFFEYNRIIKDRANWIYYASVASTGWTLAIVLPHNELFASLHRISLISAILALLGSFLLVVTMIMISRRIIRPLKQVVKLTHEISHGNFDTKISLPQSKDEIYHLSVSVNRMQDAIKRHISDLQIATIKDERIESELNIARSIQMSMLPRTFPDEKTLSISAILNPAKAVGGDFYDYFHIDDEHICFVIADVSGKGVPAALFMSVTMSYIRAYATASKTPSQIINTVNTMIALNNDANMFVTIFLGIIDIKSGALSYVNAGHTEPYLISSGKKPRALKFCGNPVVGAFEGVEYKEEEIMLHADEKLFLYTDGVNEAFSKDDEQFGEERLENLLEQSTGLTPSKTVEKVKEALEIFCHDHEQSDDITMLIVHFKENNK